MSANCWRSLPASKILPQVVDLGLQWGVLLFQFICHEISLASRKCVARISAPRIIAHRYATIAVPGIERGTGKPAHKAQPAPCGSCDRGCRDPPKRIDRRRLPVFVAESSQRSFSIAASRSAASAVSRRHCRHTSRRSKYSPELRPLQRPLPHFVGKNRFVANKRSQPLSARIQPSVRGAR